MPVEKNPFPKTADELNKAQRENVPPHMFAMVCDAESDFPIARLQRSEAARNGIATASPPIACML